MLKPLLVAISLAVPLSALAADPKEQTPQQQKMAACNKEAGTKKLEGDARKKFMSDCLSTDAKPAPSSKQTAQQEKMTACNKQAGEKKLEGDARKKFMSSCLSG